MEALRKVMDEGDPVGDNWGRKVAANRYAYTS